MTIHLWIIRKFAHQFIITVITSPDGEGAKSPGKCHGSPNLGMILQRRCIWSLLVYLHMIMWYLHIIYIYMFRHMFCAILPWSSICLDVCMHDRCIYLCLICTRNSQTPRCQKHDTHHHIGIKTYSTLPWVHINSTWEKKAIEPHWSS